MIGSSDQNSFGRWYRSSRAWGAHNPTWMPLRLHIMPFSRGFGPGRMMPSDIVGGRFCPSGPTPPLMWPFLAVYGIKSYKREDTSCFYAQVGVRFYP